MDWVFLGLIAAAFIVFFLKKRAEDYRLDESWAQEAQRLDLRQVDPGPVAPKPLGLRRAVALQGKIKDRDVILWRGEIDTGESESIEEWAVFPHAGEGLPEFEVHPKGVLDTLLGGWARVKLNVNTGFEQIYSATGPDIHALMSLFGEQLTFELGRFPGWIIRSKKGALLLRVEDRLEGGMLPEEWESFLLSAANLVELIEQNAWK